MKLLKASTFVTILLLNAVLTLGIMSLRVQPVRGGGAGATMNGDVNCDDKIDIADAIGILQWQFAGGPPLCALAQDNFESRLAALETAAKQTVSMATGGYTGDGKKSQRIITGLSGKLRRVEIISPVAGGGFRWDVYDGTELDAITFSNPDFMVNEHLVNGVSTPGYPDNQGGVPYYWMAFSTPE
jgi:hypothetical protein